MDQANSKTYYNKEEYLQQIMIFRFLTEESKSDELRDTLILFNDNIRSYKFFNDLFTGIPQISIDEKLLLCRASPG